MTTHIVSVRANVIVFLVLLILLFATIGAADLPLGPLHLPAGHRDRRGQGRIDRPLLHARLLQAPPDLGRLDRLASLARDPARLDPQRFPVARLARHSRQVMATSTFMFRAAPGCKKRFVILAVYAAFPVSLAL